MNCKEVRKTIIFLIDLNLLCIILQSKSSQTRPTDQIQTLFVWCLSYKCVFIVREKEGRKKEREEGRGIKKERKKGQEWI